MRMPPATATFNDSSKPGMGMRTGSKRRHASFRTPIPSLPSNKQSGRATTWLDCRWESLASASTSGMASAAYASMSNASTSFRSSSNVPLRVGNRKDAPRDARMAFSPNTSAHPSTRNAPSHPSAEAVRSSVPTFPGSCTRSKARMRLVRMVSHRSSLGTSTSAIAKTPSELTKPAMRSMAAADTCTTRLARSRARAEISSFAFSKQNKVRMDPGKPRASLAMSKRAK
mmetsp:Transcript_3217/g.19963  ORF Transcript_3217/g.19963 Transcript_3217/m.19963 type:complete len:228 (+) Transcript_3217:5420-6103(+)